MVRDQLLAKRNAMPFSIDVTLPADTAPVFPDACCACGRNNPGDTVTVKGRRVRLAEVFLPWLWFIGKRVRVTVPVCASCRPGVLASRRWRTLGLIVNCAIVIPIALPSAKAFGLGRGASRLLGLAFALLGLAPYCLWLLFHPPMLDLTVSPNLVTYEFALRSYAVDFLAANESATSADLPPRSTKRAER